jgi:hypothetical protein
MGRADPACHACSPQPCVGARMHALLACITNRSRSPRSIATLLGCAPQHVHSLNGWHLLGLLRRLSHAELRDLAHQIGFSYRELTACIDRLDVDHDIISTPATTRAQLTAVVFQNLPAGCHPEDLAHHLNWTLSTVYDTVQAVFDHQPDGIRLCITGDGRLVLRADDACLSPLSPDVRSRADPAFRLDPDLAVSLWHLCNHGASGDIPEHHLAALRAAGLIATDGHNVHPTIDVAHSLQFY